MRKNRVSTLDSVKRLLYYAEAEKPDGFTYTDVSNDLGWSKGTFDRIARATRDELAGTSKMLACEPQGPGYPWLWRLTDEYDPVRQWMYACLNYMRRRGLTWHAMSSSAMAMTTARSRDGKQARIFGKYVGRMLEDLDELNAETVI